MKALFLLFCIFISTQLFSAQKITAVIVKNLPFLYKIEDDGTLTGFGVEVLEKIAKDANIEVKYIVKSSFQEAFEALENKEADIFPSIWITENRKKNFLFTTSTNVSTIRAFKRKTSHDINFLEDIKNKKVVIPNNIIRKKIMQGHPKDLLILKSAENIKLADDYAFSDLISGIADVWIYTEQKFKYFSATQNKYDLIEPFGKSLAEYQRAIAIRKDKPKLAQKLDKALKKFKNTQEYIELYDKWLNPKNINKIILTKEEKNYLKNKKVLRTHIESAWYPYSYYEKNIPSGFILDYQKLIASSLGLKLEVKKSSFNKAINALEENKIDFIIEGFFGISNSNNIIIDDSKVRIPYHNILVSKEKIKSIKELRGKKIGTIAGSSKLLQKYENIDVLEYENETELFNALVKNEIDGLIDELLTSKYYLDKFAISSFYHINHIFDLEDMPKLFFTTNKENKILISIINKMLFSEDIKQLKEKWGLIQSNSEISKNLKPFLFLGNMNYEPLEFVQNNQYKGLVIDLTKAIFKKANINAKIQLMDWAKAQEFVKDNKADALMQININEDRLKYLDFSNDLLTSKFVIYKKSERKDLKDIYSFNNKTVAVFNKSYSASLIKKYPKIKTKIIKTMKEGLELLLKNKVDGVLNDSHSGDYTISINNFKGIIKLETPLDNSHSHIAVRKGNKKLLNAINEGLRIINEDGTRKNIIAKWAGKELTYLSKEEIENLKIMSNLSLNAKEKQYFYHKNEFNVCLKDNYYPLFDSREGKVTGFLGDVLKEVEKELNIDFKALKLWNDKEYANNINTKCDLIFTSQQGSDLFNNYNISIPILFQKIVAIGNINNPFIDNLSKDKNKKFYVKDMEQEKLIKKYYPKLNLIVNNDIKNVMDMVHKDKNSIFMSTTITAEHFIQRYGPDKFKVIDTLDKLNINEVIAVNNKYPYLLSSLNKALKKIGQEKISQIADLYYVKEYKIEKSNEWLWYIIGILITIGFLLQYRHIKLLKTKQKKEEELLEIYTQTEIATNSYTSEIDEDLRNFSITDNAFNIYEIKAVKNPSYELFFKYIDKQSIKRIKKSYTGKKRESFRIKIKTEKGNIKYLDVLKTQKVLENGKKRLYFTAHDITKKVLLEKEDKKKTFELEKQLNLNKKINKNLEEVNIQLEEYKNSLEEKVFEQTKKIKQQQVVLLEQSKNASLGEMIGNIAHQWRQPLNVISTAASSLQLEYEFSNFTKESLYKTTNMILKSTSFLSDTIEIFRNFLQNNKEKNDIKLYDLVKKGLSLVEDSLKNNYIKVINNIEESNSPLIYQIQDNEFSQVIINILSNTKDIVLERQIEEPWVKIDYYTLENSIVLTIEDNAKGMEEEVLKKIFEPYFTTKHQAQGTGLGLYMSYRIISESIRGKIWAQNSEFGAKFYIEIPL